MLRTTLLAILAAALAGGCATADTRGWSGSGATPFDQAQATCTAEAAPRPAGTAREAAFEACMAGHGWHRPGAVPAP
ncbi:hypothetical protein [Cognatiluteimonas weifangensis]|uniref:Lipoprotein n=1 Tax=Cognatiluteimonas weifangensis TaxID=2303539 RepID=A0A372DN82_9GAMM|nr:hypothetical protein [Luteimonas weifangensis]RFP60897.1 hypothetical protein D0Y53_07120 [Luteimonas weifangensis]